MRGGRAAQGREAEQLQQEGCWGGRLGSFSGCSRREAEAGGWAASAAVAGGRLGWEAEQLQRLRLYEGGWGGLGNWSWSLGGSTGG